MKHLIKKAILFLGLLVITYACQKDDSFKQEKEQSIESIKAFNLTAEKIPAHILNYIGTKTNHTFRVYIEKKHIKLSNTPINAQFRETPLGIVQTNKVVQVYNEHNIKYTFKVSDPNNAESVINLIVVDMGEEIIEYFIQYIFDPNVAKPVNEKGIIDMTRFTGAMLFYDNEGVNIGNYVLNEGEVLTAIGNTNPCYTYPDPDNNTGNSSGSGQSSNSDPSGSGQSSDSDSSNGNTSGGGPENVEEFENVGYDCIELTFKPCCNGDEGCAGNADGHAAGPGCGCGNGSPTTITDNCTGSSYTYQARAGGNTEGETPDTLSPCAGEVGVITLDEEILKDIIEECLIEDYNAEWFDNPNNVSSEDLEAIAAYLSENCSEYSKTLVLEFLEVKEEIVNAKFARYLELLSLIEENPWVLLQNCAEQNGLDISNFIELYEFELPQECQTRLNSLGDDYYHQPIEEGNVPLANIDYYSVEITTYPDFDNDGNPDNEGQIYEAFRQSFIDFASGELQDFQFNCNIPFNISNTADIFWDFVPFSPYDETLFLSDNPLSSILLIEAGADGLLTNMSADEGAIIVSGFTPNDWTISTIYTEETETQPFSGNRQWGWLINESNNLELFTRAVDVARVSDLIKSDPFNDEECQQNDYYNIAEATWENMQNEITIWINENGGQANIIPKTAIRIDKSKISDLLESNDVLNEIPCD